MASAIGFEDSSGLPVEEADETQEDFSEFGDIQRALAQESGQLAEQVESADQEEVESLVEHGLDSADLEADALGPDDEPESPKKKAKGNRADKRIQTLVKERKQLEQQLHQRDHYYQQHLAAMQNQIAEQKAGDSKALQDQLELQRKQLEYLQMQRDTDSQGDLTPMEEYRLNIIKEASEKAGNKFSPEVEALREELEGLKAARQEEAQKTQRQQRYNYYNQQTQAARDGILLKDFAPDRAKQLAEPMDEMLLAFCGAFGIEPNKAAPQFKKYLDLYVQGSLETRARGGGQKIRKGRAVPKSAAGGKRSAKQGNKFPKPDVLRKAGFDSALDWIAAGEPIIT